MTAALGPEAEIVSKLRLTKSCCRLQTESLVYYIEKFQTEASILTHNSRAEAFELFSARDFGDKHPFLNSLFQPHEILTDRDRITYLHKETT